VARRRRDDIISYYLHARRFTTVGPWKFQTSAFQTLQDYITKIEDRFKRREITNKQIECDHPFVVFSKITDDDRLSITANKTTSRHEFICIDNVLRHDNFWSVVKFPIQWTSIKYIVEIHRFHLPVTSRNSNTQSILWPVGPREMFRIINLLINGSGN